jgi:hypothetical protein
MFNLLENWRLLVGLAAVIAALVGGWRFRQPEIDRLKSEAAVQTAAVKSLERTVAVQARALTAERQAADERAGRLKASEKEHEELSEILDACGLRSDWAVPDALYERLCRPAPSGG